MSNAAKIIWSLQLAAVALLPNHDLLNWLFAGTILAPWKQVLVAIIAALAVSVLLAKNTLRRAPTLAQIKTLLGLLLTITILLILVSCANGLFVYRVLYGAVGYTGCVGFLLIPIGDRGRERTDAILRVAAFIGIFSCLGLIADYFTHFFSFLPRVNEFAEVFEDRLGSLRRAAFLFGATTVIFPFLSFSILASCILLKRSEGREGAVLVFVLCLLVPVTTFFSGSRATFLLSVAFAVIGLATMVPALRAGKVVVCALSALICLTAAPNIMLQHVPQASLLVERYRAVDGAEDEGNRNRFQRWEAGMQLFDTLDLDDIFGVGLGSSIKMDDGWQTTPHYESSFFQSYSEGGILGVFLRYFPGLVAVWTLLVNRRADLAIKILGAGWFLLYFVNISTSPTSAALHTQMVYFLAVGLILCDPLFGAKDRNATVLSYRKRCAPFANITD